MKKNIPYYFITIAVFIAFKLFYTQAENNSLRFLLKPTDKLVAFMTNSKSQYLSESGYFHKELNIIIDKSCSGFNFWMVSFLMLTFLGFKFIFKRTNRLLIIPIVLAISYAFTILVNTSRILFSIMVTTAQVQFTEKKFSWLHQAEGIFMYLSFLILIYLAVEYILKKNV